MSALVGLLTKLLDALSCADCARFVCNSMHFKSMCCGKGENCCSVELDTDLVSIPSESSEEFELETDCCTVRDRH